LKLLPAAISVLTVVTAFIIRNIPENISYTYQNNTIIKHSWHDIFETVTAVLFFIFVILTVAYTAICVYKKIKHKLKILGRVFKSCVMLILYFVLLLYSNAVVGIDSESAYDRSYYEFSNGLHTIIIEEKSFLLYGGGTIYQINEDNSAIVLGALSTDDGGRNYGKYQIEWFESYAEITYNTFESENAMCTQTVEFE
jgi:amino acid transporter